MRILAAFTDWGSLYVPVPTLTFACAPAALVSCTFARAYTAMSASRCSSSPSVSSWAPVAAIQVSIGLLVSDFLSFKIDAITSLSISSSYVFVVPRDVVQKAVWHQLLDCSDVAELGLELVCLIGERPQDVVSASFVRSLSLTQPINAAYAEPVSDLLLCADLRTTCCHTPSPFSSKVRFPSFCGEFGTRLHHRAVHGQAVVVAVVDAFDSKSHVCSMVRRRLHPQMQSCHVVSTLTFLCASFPVLRNQTDDSARFRCTWSILHHVLHCCRDAV